MVSEADALVPKDGLHDDEKNAGHRGRHCTDWLCLFVFLGALAAMGWIVNYAMLHGDFRRLYHGYNYYGELCGVDPAVAATPYLYWCAKPSAAVVGSVGGGAGGAAADIYRISSTLDLDHPICVRRCPADDQTTSSCFQDRTVVLGDRDPLTGTFSEQVTYTFNLVQNYPSFTFAKGYCMPSDPALYQQAVEGLEGNPVYRAMTKLPTLKDAYLALTAAAVIGFVGGYGYLFLLDKCAAILVYGCLIAATLGSGVPGALLVYSAQHEDLDSGAPPGGPTMSTGSHGLDMGLGCGLLAFSLVCLLVTCCCWRSIQLAVGCVEAACDCIFDMPGILLEPAVNIIVRWLLLGISGTGFALLLSCGEVQRHDINDYIPAGVTRSFGYTSDQYKLIAFYFLMMIWLMELCTATAQFVLAYCSQLWYFKEYVNGKKNVTWNPLCRAYGVAVWYHLGTLALGSFLVAVVRLARILLSIVAKQLKGDDKDGANGVVSCAVGCCSCCLACFEQFLRFVNKNAYMDVAINSSGFCQAAMDAFSVITQEAAAIGILNGACWIFQLAGVGTIVAAGLYATATMISTVPAFTDPASDHYIEDPSTVLGASAAILLLISIAFMTVFDVVSDTILFSFALDKQRKVKGGPSKDYAPPRLKKLVDDSKSD